MTVAKNSHRRPNIMDWKSSDNVISEGQPECSLPPFPNVRKVSCLFYFSKHRNRQHTYVSSILATNSNNWWEKSKSWASLLYRTCQCFWTIAKRECQEGDRDTKLLWKNFKLRRINKRMKCLQRKKEMSLDSIKIHYKAQICAVVTFYKKGSYFTIFPSLSN